MRKRGLFKGCVNNQRAEEIVKEQKQRDEEVPPPPQPTDRDGYVYCHLGTGTWHFFSTSPPYTDTDLGVPC